VWSLKTRYDAFGRANSFTSYDVDNHEVNQVVWQYDEWGFGDRYLYSGGFGDRCLCSRLTVAAVRNWIVGMPRIARVVVPGMPHHLTQRGRSGRRRPDAVA
jgi:hypothetical protein